MKVEPRFTPSSAIKPFSKVARGKSRDFGTDLDRVLLPETAES